MGEFSPPFSEPPSFFFFSYPSNIEIIFDFSDTITKIHPLFQNPRSALGEAAIHVKNDARRARRIACHQQDQPDPQPASAFMSGLQQRLQI